jgi:hypothetical protein
MGILRLIDCDVPSRVIRAGGAFQSGRMRRILAQALREPHTCLQWQSSMSQVHMRRSNRCTMLL